VKPQQKDQQWISRRVLDLRNSVISVVVEPRLSKYNNDDKFAMLEEGPADRDVEEMLCPFVN